MKKEQLQIVKDWKQTFPRGITVFSEIPSSEDIKKLKEGKPVEEIASSTVARDVFYEGLYPNYD